MNSLIRARTITFLGLAALLVLASAPCRADFSGDAQTSPGISPSEVQVTLGPSSYVTGNVVSSSSEQLVIRATDGRTMEFALDENRGYGAAMIPGDRVRVEYDPTTNPQAVAKNVETLGLLAVLDPTSGSPVARATGGGAREDVAYEGSDGSAAGAPGAETVDQLPATASPLPLMLVAGTLLFAAGLGVRWIDRG